VAKKAATAVKAAPKATKSAKAAKSAPGKAMTKSQFYAAIAAEADVTTVAIANIFAIMQKVVDSQLGPDGPGVVNIPDVVRIKMVDKPATKETQMISPFTKQLITVAAKPASRRARVTAYRDLGKLPVK